MACHEQVGQSSQNIDFAMIFGQPSQLSLLNAEQLLDHAKWMLNLGAYMGFGGIH